MRLLVVHDGTTVSGNNLRPAAFGGLRLLVRTLLALRRHTGTLGRTTKDWWRSPNFSGARLLDRLVVAGEIPYRAQVVVR